MKPEFFEEVKVAFERYRQHKEQTDGRIIENNDWYRRQHELSKNEDGVTPSTAHLFATLANKHADAMDNYPEPNILEREEGDRETARVLSRVVPLVLDLCRFKSTYSTAWWYKLKNGAACYGVFFDPSANSGLGDIVISHIDLLNLFWQPGISDIQKSKFLFIAGFEDATELATLYPDKKIEPDGERRLIKSYSDTGVDVSGQALVIDCYYKRGGAVHLLKYTGEEILYSSEDEGAPIYDHGLYPVVIDAMYPTPDDLVGFGLVDVIKNPQLYIDKLDEIISKNALISGKVRWLVKDNGGINEGELCDMSADVIHAAGRVDEESVRQIQARPLAAFIMEHRKNKIAELKEISGNRDFQSGGSTGGVTAYGAIVALQQAGEKMSRDMIGQSYEAYRQIIAMVIELIRQFYDEERMFRITGEDGAAEYVAFDNSALLGQAIGENLYRRPEFDVCVIPEKSNPYTKAINNQLLIQLWQMGVFEPEKADQALAFLDMLQLEGKQTLIKRIQEGKKAVTV